MIQTHFNLWSAQLPFIYPSCRPAKVLKAESNLCLSWGYHQLLPPPTYSIDLSSFPKHFSPFPDYPSVADCDSDVGAQIIQVKLTVNLPNHSCLLLALVKWGDLLEKLVVLVMMRWQYLDLREQRKGVDFDSHILILSWQASLRAMQQ